MLRRLYLLGLVACAADQPPRLEESDHPIDQLFVDLGKLPAMPPHRLEGSPSAAIPSGDFTCVDTPIDEVRQYDQLLGQLSVGDVLWPGSLLRGDSVYSGRLTPIVLGRAPLTFSVSLESLGNGTRSATMQAPSLSAYRDAIGDILAQTLSGSTPARISAEVEEISSEDQLSVALGASASAPLVGTVKGGFNFADTKQRSRFMVKFFQLYYTVDVDPPALPHDFFSTDVSADQVAPFLGPDNPPVYVSSIGYGRQVLFTFESELSKSEVQAALEFVYKGGADISGSTSLTHKEVLSHTHTTAFILGGDAGEAAAVSIGDYNQLVAFIGRGGNYSKDSPGAAIAYKLSYVRDHTPVQISYASNYTQRDCTRVSQNLHVVLEKLSVISAGGDLGDDLEVLGTVTVTGATGTHTLASWPSYIQVAEGTSYPQSGIIGEQVIAVRPQAGNTVRVTTTLHEDDGLSDDTFGTDEVDTAPFEAGWRRTLQVNRISGSQYIALRISLTPVP